MIQLVYTREAIDDLKRLRLFTATHNPDAARKVAAELINRINLLQQMPMMGHPVSQAPDPEVIRDMVFGAYIVRYAIHNQSLAIRNYSALVNKLIKTQADRDGINGFPLKASLITS